MNNLADLAVSEPVRVDTRRMREIVNELGEAAGSELIQIALEQMALAVGALRKAAAAGNGDGVVAQAERLSRLAWQVGLVTLAAVAVDVADCARRRDPVALGATLARVGRVANGSLSRIWEGLAG